MKIYLAGTGPGKQESETTKKRGMLNIPKRLLSYYHLTSSSPEFGSQVFNIIKKEKRNEKAGLNHST